VNLLWNNYYVIIVEMFKLTFTNTAQFGTVFNPKGVVMLRILCAVAFFCCMSLLSGCASIVNGQNQPVSVDTPNCAPAKCELTNEKGSWFVTTPGSVTVRRAYGDMTVICTKAGVPAATLKVQSATKAMAFGNIIFGGVIGAGIDAGTGAAYDYPALISVDMACNGAVSGAVTPAAEVPVSAQPAK
jgi:hypothetical protein